MRGEGEGVMRRGGGECTSKLRTHGKRVLGRIRPSRVRERVRGRSPGVGEGVRIGSRRGSKIGRENVVGGRVDSVVEMGVGG